MKNAPGNVEKCTRVLLSDQQQCSGSTRGRSATLYLRLISDTEWLGHPVQLYEIGAQQ